MCFPRQIRTREKVMPKKEECVHVPALLRGVGFSPDREAEGIGSDDRPWLKCPALDFIH